MSTSPNVPNQVHLQAPAKVNLALRVLSRRSDGYHEIDSLFVPVDLCDEMRVSRVPGSQGQLEIRCSDPSLPVDARNLAWRAVEEFYRHRSKRPGLVVEIEKRIPCRAGLGGGSSDAAAVLRSLARLEGVPERSESLLAAAARIGADVPFFLWCCPARVRGIGEIIEPIEGFPRLWMAIVFPGAAISTAWAYEALDKTLTSRGTADRIRRFCKRDPDLRDIFNDFEGVIESKVPEISELKRDLLSLGAQASGLSGSGSAVFGLFKDRATAEIAADVKRREGFWAVSAGTLSAPPPDDPNVRWTFP